MEKEQNNNVEKLEDVLKIVNSDNYLWGFMAIKDKWVVYPTDGGPVVVAWDTDKAIEALKKNDLIGDGWVLKDSRTRVFVLDIKTETFKERIIKGNEELGG